ncbi:MAG: rhodanese-like domain-containing protein [Pseudomonadota bacterium]
MAASFTTSSATWRREPMALARNTLAGLSLALILAACSDNAERSDPDESDSSGGAPPPSIIPQLAAVDTGIAAESTVIDLAVADAYQLVQAGKARLIDVRTDEEVAQGMIPGAEHIAMSHFDPAQVSASGNLPVILYCRSGRRSRIVAEQLAAEVDKPVAHVEGGILSWQARGLPITAPVAAR